MVAALVIFANTGLTSRLHVFIRSLARPLSRLVLCHPAHILQLTKNHWLKPGGTPSLTHMAWSESTAPGQHVLLISIGASAKAARGGQTRFPRRDLFRTLFSTLFRTLFRTSTQKKGEDRGGCFKKRIVCM